MEQRNLKLAKSKFISIENRNDVTCNNQKQFPMSNKMAVSFKLNNPNFPPLTFSSVSKPVSFVPLLLSFATACGSSIYASALSHKSLSDPTNVCDGTVCSSSVYSSKPIRPSKPVCLSNVRSSKLTISSNFYLSKPVCPRNITSFSRSSRSSDVCQGRSKVIPSKPVRSSDIYPSKPVHIWPSKPAGLSNICLSKPVCPVYVCPSKPVQPSNVYSSKPVCLSIVTSNIFINLILFKVIFLTNYTCLRKHLILFISLNGSYLRSMLDTVIIFQSFRTILKMSISDVFVYFLICFCVFLRCS